MVRSGLLVYALMSFKSKPFGMFLSTRYLKLKPNIRNLLFVKYKI